MALAVANLERRTTVIPEIEFGKVAMQMRFAAMPIDADYATLEDRKHVLNRVGVNHGVSFS